MPHHSFERIDPAHPRAVALIAALDAAIISRYPGETTNGIDPAAFRAAGGVFLIATMDGADAGCGAFRPVDLEGFANTAEIKRMFVHPACRGCGVAKGVLNELEKHAAAAGFQRAILETGKRLTEAVSLYHRSGYTVIPNYGQYVGNAESVCFEKSLNTRA